MAAPKPCKVGSCDRPKKKGKHFCEWHWLARQSSDVQATASLRRRAMSEEAGRDFRARVPQAEWPDGERWCSGCQSFVPLFYCSGSRCKACTSMAAHEKRVQDTYGISGEEYARLLALQGGRCAICRNVPRTIRLAVDHNHKTGAVRGLLCKRCNHDLLGGGHDDVVMLYRALEYLLYPPAERDVRPDRARVLRALEEHLELAERLAAPKLRQSEPPPF